MRGGDAEPAPHEATTIRRQAWLLTFGCVATALLCVVLARADRRQAAELVARQGRAAELAADAEAIASLRHVPQQAGEVGLPPGDLLASVAQAMTEAGLPAERLISTLPQPPRRLPHSPHAEVVHRLVFEQVSLEPLVRFCHALTSRNLALRVGGFQFRAGRERTLWNVDVSVSYWVLAPEGAGEAAR